MFSSRSSFMRRRRLLGLSGAMLALGAWSAQAVSREPLPVVATMSILGDMVKEIGGDRVSVTTIIGRDDDTYSFEPAPEDAKTLQRARVLVLNGLDFEPWLQQLTREAGFEGSKVLASAGVAVRRLSGSKNQAQHPEVDPHAWLDLSNGMIYARNIATGLSRADPRNAAYYESRAAGYMARMQALDNEIRATIGAIPQEQRRVIISYDAFGYFGAAYGVEFIPVTDISSRDEPSARDVARIIRLARELNVSGAFVENMSNSAMAQQIARDSGVLMGGTLYTDALGAPDQPAATYLGMLSWNAGRVAYVLRKALP